ncbi:hypothetical protein Cgig2_003401 [Carnegiea gigantea]|uniref:Uncharacterized protein n=1 Tax=Carnegiea gigantea TaxID=171969 RepID=A0A9Q1KA92_9CARY|nr:hypothetical protein Cgig2_003401 [Carnegiea gigantea]
MIFPVSVLADHVVNRILEALESFVTAKFHELYGVQSEIENLSRQFQAIQAVLEDAQRFQQGSHSTVQQVWLTGLQDLALDLEDVLALYATEAPLWSKQKFTAPFAWLRFRSEAASKIKEVAKNIDTVSKEKNKFHSGEGHNEMLEFVTGTKQDMMAANEDRILQELAERRFLLVLDDVWLDKLEWESLHRVLKLCHRQGKVLITSRNEKVTEKMDALHIQRLDVMPEDECWTLFSKRVFRAGKCSEELEQFGKEIIRRCKFLPLAVKAMAGLLCRDPSEQRLKNILKNGIWISDQSHFGNDTSDILPALKLSYDDLPHQLKKCFEYCCLFPKGYMFEKNELVRLWIVEGYIKPVGAEDSFDELRSRSFFRLLDVNIDKNELIKLWIAEGRISDIDHMEDVSIHFKELLNSRQLANYTERYKMHDLIHDMARDISSGCQQVEENDSSSIKQQSRHISFLGQDAKKLTEGVLKAQKLRTLLLPTVHPKDFGQTLDEMFRTLSYLRVLDLSASTIKDLPESIGELKLLGYLDLSRTEIRMLPNTICNLHNLQILKLLWCLWLWKLPKDFGNLKKLMYLELDNMFWYKCSALPPKIGGLTNLHYLYSFHVRRKSGYGIDELGCMNSLEGTLRISNLENSEDAKCAKLKQKESISGLVLEWSDKDADPQGKTAQERVLEDLEPHHGLEELHINHFKGNRFSSWMGMLRCLKEVSLNHCINCRALSLGPLPHLSVLRIKGMLELVQWPEIIYGSLTRLSISNCPKLRELPGNFPNLVSAKIKQCDALTALFPLMPSLTSMVLMNNALLEEWCQDVSTTGYSFRIYLELRVINCPKLQELPQIFYPQKLEVSGCTSLRTIPGPQCSQLQCLELDKCIGTSLLEAIPSTSSLYSLSISNVKNLANLPQFPHLPGLQALYIDNCDDLTSLSSKSDSLLQSLTSLKFLSISGCRAMKTFQDGLPTSIEWLNIKDCSMLKSFHSRNFLTNLTSLKDLYLEDCPQLEFLPEDGIPTGLQHLCIRGCPLLTQKCSKNTGGQYWPMISHIDDLEIDFIKTPEPHTATCPGIRCLGCFGA